MLKNNDIFVCRVCGHLTPQFPPWGYDGRTPSFEICDCCGVEFGYEDATLIGSRNYRAKWIEAGAKWFRPKNKPDGWAVEEQLANIPDFFM